MRFARLTLAVLLLSGALCAQNSPFDWFPVHVGDRWIYEYSTRDVSESGRRHVEVHRWNTEETAVASWPIPEGTLIEMRVRVTSGSAPAGWENSRSRAYLLRGNCLYSDVEWNAPAHRITPNFLKGLSTDISPDFCFPLLVRKLWGAPHGLPDWGVTRPEEAKDWRVVEVTGHNPQKTFHVTSNSSYLGSGMISDIWYMQGVGVVREVTVHRGTLGEHRTKLLHFEPRAANR